MTTTTYTVRNTSDIEKIEDGMQTLPISRTDGKKGKSGMCIVVPAVSDSVLALVGNSEIGQQWMRDRIDDLRSQIASSLNKQGKLIVSDKLGIDGLLAAMKVANESERLTKESIAKWFKSDLAPLLIKKLVEKYPNINEKDAEKKLAPYLEGYQVCAMRESNRSMKSDVKVTLLAQFDKFPEDYDSPIAAKVMAILETIPETAEMLEAL